MTQTLVSVVAFVLLLALVPAGIKWVQARARAGVPAAGPGTKLISAVALGPQQRVVTVEVGPQGARTWLVLGVTPQAISLLHQSTTPCDTPSTRAGVLPALAVRS